MSIGDSDKLNVFLDENPKVQRKDFFVDGYDLNVYSAVGFNKKFTESGPEQVTKVAPPDLSPRQWMSYLGSASKVQPIPKGQSLQFPEGVLRLGGTLIVNGNDVVYQWNDLIPGDHPSIDYVLAVAKEVALESSAPLST